jgi:hypothetical protein
MREWPVARSAPIEAPGGRCGTGGSNVALHYTLLQPFKHGLSLLVSSGMRSRAAERADSQNLQFSCQASRSKMQCPS